jgi:hypothetical protein
MLRKFLAIATIAVAFSQTAFSQDSTKTPTFTLSGSLDAYYRYNFHNAKDSMHLNNYTSFTNSQNSFELGMATVKAEASMGKVGATLDLGFGTRANEFSYNEYATRSTLSAVKQAFVTFAPSSHVKFTMGKWGTHVGYEVLDAYLNRNYSMDYMFSYGPFSHTGLKADFTLGAIGLMVGVVNPTDYVSAPFSKKNFVAQLSGGSKSGKVKAFLNYVGGKDLGDNSVNQVDLVVTGTVTDKFSVGYNGTVKSVKPSGGDGHSWWGSAVYLNVDPTSIFGLTLRGEYFGDKNGVAGFGTNIFDATLSGNIRAGNLTIIPEFRLDTSKDPLFFKNSDTFDPSSKSTGTFILAATYHF